MKDTRKIILYIAMSLDGYIAKQDDDIYCDGGAETVHQLLQEDMIDELTISIIPIFLGDGIRLFKGGLQELKLQLVNVKSFEKGLVQMRYIRMRN
ncbi:MAG: dihydrofolate reductase family protein [Bacteroidota bacterium]|nr:dihydrofolate reductase family protein [Bacteroidota bacterium]